jgi:hypothetical protein
VCTYAGLQYVWTYFQALNLVSTQSQSLIRYEAELAQLKGKVSSLTADLEQKDMLLLSKDQAMAEIRVQLSCSRHKAEEEPQRVVEQPVEEQKVEEDPTEKLALKVTCHSMFYIYRLNLFTQLQSHLRFSFLGLPFITFY